MWDQIVIWPISIRINPSLCRKEAFKIMSLEHYQWTGSKIMDMKFTPKTPKYGLYIKVCSSIWVKCMYTLKFQKWITFPKVNILSHISYGHCCKPVYKQLFQAVNLLLQYSPISLHYYCEFLSLLFNCYVFQVILTDILKKITPFTCFPIFSSWFLYERFLKFK